jgi:hypothetical protein
VEFALVLPLILLIIFVFLDLGRMVFIHAALTNAVREGARFAVVHKFETGVPWEQDIQNMVVDKTLVYPLTAGDVLVDCDHLLPNQDYPCNEDVTVSAQVQVSPMVFFVAWIMGGGSSFNITADSTMQMTPYGYQ